MPRDTFSVVAAKLAAQKKLEAAPFINGKFSPTNGSKQRNHNGTASPSSPSPKTPLQHVVAKFGVRTLRESQTDDEIVVARAHKKAKNGQKTGHHVVSKSAAQIKPAANILPPIVKQPPPVKSILKTNLVDAAKSDEIGRLIAVRRDRIKACIDRYVLDLHQKLEKNPDLKQSIVETLLRVEHDDECDRINVAKLFGMVPTYTITDHQTSQQFVNVTPRNNLESLAIQDNDEKLVKIQLKPPSVQFDTADALSETESASSLSDMAIFGSRIVYVADPNNGLVKRFDLWQQNHRCLGDIPGLSSCNRPSQMALDQSSCTGTAGAGEILIACRGDETIYLFEIDQSSQKHRLVKAYPNLYTPNIGALTMMPAAKGSKQQLKGQFVMADSDQGMLSLISRQGNSMLQVKHVDLLRASCSTLAEDTTGRCVVLVGSNRGVLSGFDGATFQHIFSWPQCDKRAPERISQINALAVFHNYIVVVDQLSNLIHELEMLPNNKATPIVYRRSFTGDFQEPVAVRVLYHQIDRKEIVLLVAERQGLVKTFVLPKVVLQKTSANGEKPDNR